MSLIIDFVRGRLLIVLFGRRRCLKGYYEGTEYATCHAHKLHPRWDLLVDEHVHEERYEDFETIDSLNRTTLACLKGLRHRGSANQR